MFSACRFSQLKDVLQLYQEDGDMDRAYEALVSGNWARTFLMGKPKSQITNFKDHVSQRCILRRLRSFYWYDYITRSDQVTFNF